MAENYRVAIVTGQQVVPTNPTVRGLASRWRWQPTTVIARIEENLPVLLQRKMFLVISEDWPLGMRPDTFAKVLEIIVSNRDIPRDRIEEVGRKLEHICSVFDTCKENEVNIGWLTVAELVSAYGEDTEKMVELIIDEAFFISEQLGLRLPENIAASVFLKKIARHCSGESDRWLPNTWTTEEVVGLLRRSPIFLEEYLQEEVGDE